MRKNKLQKIAEANNSEKLIQRGTQQYEDIIGGWENFFGNTHPIVLEVGCGRGEYTVGLAKLFPNKNFVGIDIKGERLWKGIQQMNEKKLTNVGFIRGYVEDVGKLFPIGALSEIWITHPGPWPKSGDAKRRLTSPRFLNMFCEVLQSGGKIFLKTDNQDFFSYSWEQFSLQHSGKIVSDTNDLYTSNLIGDHYGITTVFEQHALRDGEKICYLVWEKN